jgi:RNA polymerase sigma-70 factor (ECF subfamily)
MMGEPGSDADYIAESGRRPERFAVLFDRHFAAVHRYLARRAGREAADDLASLCFTVAFERRGSFDPRFGDARPWLYGIASNLLRQHWRAEERVLATVSELKEDPACRDPDGHGMTSGGDDAELARALASLDPAQRDVLLLYAWEELSYEEISVALNVPVGTVRSRLARARARVRAELEAPVTAPVKEQT